MGVIPILALVQGERGAGIDLVGYLPFGQKLYAIRTALCRGNQRLVAEDAIVVALARQGDVVDEAEGHIGVSLVESLQRKDDLTGRTPIHTHASRCHTLIFQFPID